MFDTLAAARSMAAAGMDAKHADAVAASMHDAMNQADYATKGDIAELRAELRADSAALETRLIRWMVVLAGIIIAAQRFL